MSEVEKAEQTRTTLWHVKLMIFAGWTILTGALWFAVVATMSGKGPDPGQTMAEHEAAIGGAACLMTGMSGCCWISGIAVIVLIFAALRR
jgi:hypothetical protein